MSIRSRGCTRKTVGLETIFKTISRLLPLSPEIEELLQKRIRPVTIKKKELLLEPGKQIQSIYYINKGLLRGFFHHKRKDITTWFSLEGEVTTSLTSLIT